MRVWYVNALMVLLLSACNPLEQSGRSGSVQYLANDAGKARHTVVKPVNRSQDYVMWFELKP